MRRSGTLLLLAATVLLVLGFLLGWIPWAIAGALGAVAAVAAVVRGVRHKRAGVDILALLAIVGALATEEFLAAAILTVMVGTGQFLEERAQARASRELTLLAQRAPAIARRVEEHGVRELPVEEVRAGDTLVLAAGDIVPVDGRLVDPGTFDESVLTGEALPVHRQAGDVVRSGVVNAGHPTQMLATAPASESTYAGVVRLVQGAQAAAAPFVRLADRLAFWFVPLALAVAGFGWWFNGTPNAAVAVLVVATPCPLLLAVPIAIIGGVSQCAKRGVVVKGGASLEELAVGRVLLFDKTGTLTAGRPEVVHIALAPDTTETEVLRMAASLDQMSPHVLATAIVNAARDRGIRLVMPSAVQEVHGSGVQGEVEGRQVRIGRPAWVMQGAPEPPWAHRAQRRADLESALITFVGVEGTPLGALLFADRIRPDAPGMVRSLRGHGMDRIVLVSGDRADVAESIGRIVGVDAVWADQTPPDKVEVVVEESLRGPSIMVGDGINDAPALAAAGVGVALAARGATASSEAADVVLTVDRIDRLGEAVAIARGAHRTASEAAWLGMGLCFVAMAFAAVGMLPATVGALLQEGIDAVAIAWALRVGLRHPPTRQIALEDAEVLERLSRDHRDTLGLVERVREVADALDDDGSLRESQDLLAELETVLLPHERQEEAELVPALTRITGSPEAVGALSRSHAEIEHHVALLHRLLDDPDPEGVTDVRRTLYGLYGVLRLHNALEEETAFALVEQ